MNKNICVQCNLEFNKNDRVPKILPCLTLKCLRCLSSDGGKLSFDEERAIDCKNCSRIHLISNINDLPTSEITLFLNECSVQELVSTNLESNPISKSKLKSFSESFFQLIREENFKFFKHYDNAIADIDVRTEQLISFVVESGEKLKDKIKSSYEESLNFLSCNTQNFIDDQKNSDIINVKLNCLSLDTISINENEDLITVLANANKLQQHLFYLEKSLCYFMKNSIDFDKNFLGCILNSLNDQNYLRIKKLSTILDNSQKVTLDLEHAQNLLRHEILPIERIIKINFTTYKGLLVEAFDRLTGKIIKTSSAFEGVSSFPLICGFDRYFCLSFTSVGDLNGNHCVRLYDTDLNLIKSMNKHSSIESVFMNDNYIILTFAHQINKCCEVYDFNLNELFSFGQQTNKENGFYMEKSQITMNEAKKFNLKMNPQIFGFTKNQIFLRNHNKMFIMERESGHVTKALTLEGHRPNFLLDCQNNVIQVDSLCRKISLLNSDLDVLIEHIYKDDLDEVFITRDNRLAFVDIEKSFVVYV